MKLPFVGREPGCLRSAGSPCLWLALARLLVAELVCIGAANELANNIRCCQPVGVTKRDHHVPLIVGHADADTVPPTVHFWHIPGVSLLRTRAIDFRHSFSGNADDM